MAFIFWSSLIHSSKCKDLLLSSHVSVVLLNKFRVTCVSCFGKCYRKRRRRCAAVAVISVTLTLSDIELLFASWAMESWCDLSDCWNSSSPTFCYFYRNGVLRVDINKVGRAASHLLDGAFRSCQGQLSNQYGHKSRTWPRLLSSHKTLLLHSIPVNSSSSILVRSFQLW